VEFINRLSKLHSRIIFGILSIIISILELLYLNKLNVDYKGIYNVAIFEGMVIIQALFWYIVLFKKDKLKHYNIRLIICVMISSILLIGMFLTPPRYSYEDGKEIILSKFDLEKEFDFLEESLNRDIISVHNNPKWIFTANKNYYYVVNQGNNTRFFTVNPIDGKEFELSSDFWEDGRGFKY